MCFLLTPQAPIWMSWCTFGDMLVVIDSKVRCVPISTVMSSLLDCDRCANNRLAHHCVALWVTCLSSVTLVWGWGRSITSLSFILIYYSNITSWFTYFHLQRSVLHYFLQYNIIHHCGVIQLHGSSVVGAKKTLMQSHWIQTELSFLWLCQFASCLRCGQIVIVRPT